MWAGTVNLRVGDHLVGVEYDDEPTAEAIRRRCAAWLDNSEVDRPAAFGVRTAPVGLRRRRVGVVHYGTTVRHRTPDLDSAVSALAAILAGLEAGPAPGEVHVATRLLIRDDRAAMLALPDRIDLDDRRLRKAQIEEVPGWRVVLDARSGEVARGAARYRLVAIIEANPAVAPSLDDARRHLWSLGEGEVERWADLLDQRGHLIVRAPDDTAADAVIDALT